ncbi:MAG: hypothetical protein CME59_02660 [Halioglobus sp.]|nr:hypothetical protein [Halioglobus sp.]|tara:strand:+ start:879 stop:1613 length:735 start_codon:yes stop_codon:yes gene_type:complete
MLFGIDELKGMKLSALDGEIGKCMDFLFDDEHWAIRYMDARAGSWLTGRRVLISPISLGGPDWDAGQLPVRLSREQIKDSPAPAQDQPVSRDFERSFFKFYGYGYYWMGGATWGAGLLPSELENRYLAETVDDDSKDNHLRSLQEVTHYKVMAGGEKVGRLDNLLVDAASWTAPYVVVDTGNWLAHERVVLPSRWVGDISWAKREVVLQVASQQVEAAPALRSAAPLSRDDESRYQNYFDSAAA